MELITLLSALLVLAIVSLSTFFVLYYNTPTKDGKTLPPGRMGWPFIGESYDFFAAGWKGKPESFIFDRLKKFAKGNLNGQFRTSLFGNKSIVVAGAAANKLLFSNEKKLVTMWWPPSIDKAFPSTAQLSANEEALLMRKFFPSFLIRREALQRYIPIMDDCTRRHFATGAWGPSDKIEAFNVTQDYTFWVACRVFMSIDAQEDPETVDSLFRHFNVLKAGIYSMHIDLPWTNFHHAMKASHAIRSAVEQIAKKRRAELAEGKAFPTQDMLSYMLETPITSAEDSKDGKAKYLNDADIGTKILGLLVGGHDTSSTVIAFFFKFMAENPHVYEAIYKEQMEVAATKAPGELLNWDDLQKMKYSWCAICEVMRLTPPVQGAFRQAITDFTHNGYLIPKGWKIYWSTHSTHRNPEIFPQPEKFDPTRFEGNGPPAFSFVPFGGGPRMCPGKEYARLQVLTFVHHIVTKFKWEQILPNEKIIVSPMPYPEKNLPLRMIARSESATLA
ncbi:hypothetical protein RND81_08G189800 [Saponaria officinalis]|uniref:Beta-amyrin 28-monooxygenase CYP716A379 n=1 Tax=Saponaria officinalis TaxID=3572 RepID=C7169_SAPOF